MSAEPETFAVLLKAIVRYDVDDEEEEGTIISCTTELDAHGASYFSRLTIRWPDHEDSEFGNDGGKWFQILDGDLTSVYVHIKVIK